MAKANGNGKAPTTPTIDTETLRGDIRDILLIEFRQMPKPWQQMAEREQQEYIDRATKVADSLVRQAVDLIAARGLNSLAITVGKFTCEASAIKGNYEAYASDEALLSIRHLCDRRAMFVLADPSEYLGEKAPAKPDNVGDLAMPAGGAPFHAPAESDEPRTARAD